MKRGGEEGKKKLVDGIRNMSGWVRKDKVGIEIIGAKIGNDVKEGGIKKSEVGREEKGKE
ncbi:hypothetical protein [Staphylococcus aureus]|uniref:hypothetical protein n=1 Tax=Staphylococcus aureus TaxID=1280 RepID=UPI0011D2AE2D|nr:hypothetical protein [Staphylococcus aureus]